MSLRDRMTRLDKELVEAREVLERVAPGEPRVQAPATVAEAFALADAALAAKAKENVRLPEYIATNPTRSRSKRPPRDPLATIPFTTRNFSSAFFFSFRVKAPRRLAPPR